VLNLSEVEWHSVELLGNGVSLGRSGVSQDKLSLAALNLSEPERHSVKTCQKWSAAVLNFSEMGRRSEVKCRSVKLVRSEVLQR